MISYPYYFELRRTMSDVHDTYSYEILYEYEYVAVAG